MTPFDYRVAFSRNIGWVTEEEQNKLRGSRVAIAGMGGVGGSHLLTLTRLGVGRFNLADFDSFAVENFNRQAGANLNTVDRPKLESLSEMANSINPELEIHAFPDGVSPEQAERFLEGCDIYLDGLDFFALTARRAVFAACDRLGIPAVTAAPLGMGSALLSFLPGKLTFEDYFQLEGHGEYQQYLRFLVGLAPSRLHSGYLVLPERIDLIGKKGPSTAMGCELCAGFAATQVLKLLLGRGKVLPAPWGQQFDAYMNRLHRTWRPGGNRHPLQQLAIRLGERALAKQLNTL
ncbi:MAG: ThiF family adenylyltransferase [Candidatus Thiodiazotropha sp. (ex Myrtea spinifera)]|nr:ThiF family adenylyltransferase [Candidatus Thiodiazotropha sp. (ex Myrtea spinifera)]MCU7828276.1 ThiF family adenylyltransferase [Candidatus Thiodiazotropha sp. (ex Myrtea sp. 'scaly one' KF741663)]